MLHERDGGMRVVVAEWLRLGGREDKVGHKRAAEVRHRVRIAALKVGGGACE